VKKLKVKGVIISNEWKWIYDWFGYDSTCPKDIEDALEGAEGEEIELDINSGGGDVYAGSEIYVLLKSYKGNITGRIMGLAASAASVIGMGCTKLLMSPTAQLMIHNVSSGARGDYRDLQHSADVLKGWNTSIANAYQLKTNMEQKDLLKLMDKETWMTAQQALESKFIDEVMFDHSNQLVASFDAPTADGMIPAKVLEKLRNSGFFKGNTQTPVMNNVQEGVKSMGFEEIMSKLSEDEKTAIANHLTMEVSNAVSEKELGLVNSNAELAKENSELKSEIENLKAAVAPIENTDALANVSPEVKAMIEDANRKAAEATLALENMNNERELEKFVNKAKAFDKLPINAAEMGVVFKNFAKADEEGFQKLEALLNATNNLVTASNVFATAGTSTHSATGTAYEQMQAKATELVASNKDLSKDQAMAQVMRNETELYQQYIKEREGEE